MTYVKLHNRQIIDVDPHGAAPVILLGPVQLVPLAQAAQAMRAPELLLVAHQLQQLPELGTVGLEQPREEREQRDVALVADELVLLELVDGCVAVAAVTLGPVQVVQVALDGGRDLAVRVHVLGVAQRVGDVGERLGHDADQRQQVDVQLARVRRLRARVVVPPARQAVRLGAAAAAVGLLSREGLTVVRLDVAGL